MVPKINKTRMQRETTRKPHLRQAAHCLYNIWLDLVNKKLYMEHRMILSNNQSDF